MVRRGAAGSVAELMPSPRPGPETRCTEYGSYPVNPDDVIVNDALTTRSSYESYRRKREENAREVLAAVEAIERELEEDPSLFTADDATQIQQLRLDLENELDGWRRRAEREKAWVR